MTDPAIISASFSDWRPVKSRKVLQLIFEVPVEQTEKVLNTLGAPMPHEDNWCAIAVLTEEARSSMGEQGTLTAQAAGSNPAAPTKKRFDEMSRAQQAGLLCNEKRFQEWLMMAYGGWEHISPDITDAAERTAVWVRKYCAVQSRADLDASHAAGVNWDVLLTEYRQATGQLAEDRS